MHASLVHALLAACKSEGWGCLKDSRPASNARSTQGSSLRMHVVFVLQVVAGFSWRVFVPFFCRIGPTASNRLSSRTARLGIVLLSSSIRLDSIRFDSIVHYPSRFGFTAKRNKIHRVRRTEPQHKQRKMLCFEVCMTWLHVRAE